MDFDFHIRGLGGESHISKWDAQSLRKLNPEELQNMKTILLQFGKKSAAAQGLPAPITDLPRLQSSNQHLYLFAVRRSSSTSLLGGIKLGVKKLFVRTEHNAWAEVEPMCVLDFYVHESCQRQGVGKQLFEQALAAEQQHPGGMAYDRPSPKFLAFLKKYYGLSDYVPQNNNYVLFKQYYDLHPSAPVQRGRLAGMPSPRPGPSSLPSPSPSHRSLSTPPRPSSSSFDPQYSPAHQMQQQQQQPHPGAYFHQDPHQQQHQQQQQDAQHYNSLRHEDGPASSSGYDGPHSAPTGYGRAVPPPGQRGTTPPEYGRPVPPAGGYGSPPPGYVGTGMRTKLVIQGPDQQQQQQQQQLPPRPLQPSQSFGQRWGQSNGLIAAPQQPYGGTAQGPGPGGPGCHAGSTSGPPTGSGLGFGQDHPFSGHLHQRPPSSQSAGEDSLDSFRIQQQQGVSLALPSMQQQQQAGGRQGQRPPGPHTPSPPWATDGSAGLVPGPRNSSWSPGGGSGSGQGSSAMAAVMGRPGSGSWQGQGGQGLGSAPGWQTPPGQGQHSGPGSQPSPSARSAGLSQRAGAGAAGCLVW